MIVFIAKSLRLVVTNLILLYIVELTKDVSAYQNDVNRSPCFAGNKLLYYLYISWYTYVGE